MILQDIAKPTEEAPTPPQRSFGASERRIAGMLENLPWLRTAIKNVYKRAVYFATPRPADRCILEKGQTLMSPAEWAGTSDKSNESLFFGYYDKSPWSPDMSKMLMHYLRGSKVEITVFDRDAHDRKVIGSSAAWNWQQGSMAQWLGQGEDLSIAYNALSGKTLGCVLRNVRTEREEFHPWPIQAVNPSSTIALSLNYRRLHRLRRCYGYAQEVSNFLPNQDLDKDGIWMVNLVSGESRLVITLQQLAALLPSATRVTDHKVNHCLFSPSGSRFVFLHRYFQGPVRFTRLLTAQTSDPSPRVVLDYRHVSHYGWMDDEHLVAWARTPRDGDRYYRVNVLSGETSVIGRDTFDRLGDGHCTVSPGGATILTDSYPDKVRMEHLLLYDRRTEGIRELGAFLQPWAFDGDSRCDLHPRFSPDGRFVSFDSAHTGVRRSYIVSLPAQEA